MLNPYNLTPEQLEEYKTARYKYEYNMFRLNVAIDKALIPLQIKHQIKQVSKSITPCNQ